MLSVTTATVHRAMCPSTPQNTTPERKARFWSCDNNNALSKRRCRANTSRKNLSLRLTDPLELNVEVSSRPISIDKATEKTPKSKIPLPKIHPITPSTLKPRRHSVALLKHANNRSPNPLYKEASLKANNGTNANDADAKSSVDHQSSIQSDNEKLEGTSMGDDEKVQKQELEQQKGDNEAEESEVMKPVNSTFIEEKEKSLCSSSPRSDTSGKRKRGFESRMSLAVKMLKSDDNDVSFSKRRLNLDTTIEDSSPNEDTTIVAPSEQVLDVIYPVEAEFHTCHQSDNWNSEENWDKFQQENGMCVQTDNWVDPYNSPQAIWRNRQSNNWDSWDDVNIHAPLPAEDPLNQIHSYEPFYMTGFPNPPAENRCWLNATLQTIFALPLIDHLGQLDSMLSRCSMLTQTLVALQVFWKMGSAEKEKTYQTVRRFKAQLEILDESYSSDRQQDVSEFLMKLLNYVKSDCDKILKEMTGPDEAENVVDNSRNVKNISRSPAINKRPPLTQISPFKNRNGSNDSADRELEACSPKSQESCEESNEFLPNPIDKYFLLPMMEHFQCQNCRTHRQRKVDNMMLYVDLPENETDPIELATAIRKTLDPEDRTLTCGKCKCEQHKLWTTFRGPPNVLIVQINRYGMSDGCVAKMNTIVRIPELLKIGSYEAINEDFQCQKFIPVCTIAHVGSTMEFGHYTSYVKHGDQWFHYNDMNVTPMTTTEALTAAQTTAYLVFFVNADLLPKSPSDIEEVMEEVSR